MKTRIFLSLFLSLLPLAACAGDGATAVPDRFLGHWAVARNPARRKRTI